MRQFGVRANDSVRPLGTIEFAEDFRVSKVLFAGRTEPSAPTSLLKSSRLCVGGDAYIAPLGTNEFAGDFRKNGLYRRVDVGIDPYEPDCDMYKEQKTPSGWMAFFHGNQHSFRPRHIGMC